MSPSNYELYHQSITEELLASRNRVRYFIENRHHGEDGRYKEVLLMNYLRKILPSNVSVGTGFIKNGEKVTGQIDLIVYNNSIPTLFSEGDFVIALPESVYGIIEVKSRLTPHIFKKAVEKSNENGAAIDKDIFNGIFSFESEVTFSEDSPFNASVQEALINTNGYLNHISSGPNFFVKYWADGNPEDQNMRKCFSFYKLNNLSFGYFISNLIEQIHEESRKEKVSDTLSNFLYPIERGKETRRLRNLEVNFDVSIP